jgi:hypothetical protein
MINTELKHWVNGHQVRGGWFHTLTLSVGRIGLMICWGGGRMRGIELYKLRGDK